MDDEEEFQREIKLMERKINSIKSNIEYMKVSNQRKRKQRQVINHQQLQPLQLRNDTNLFNKQYTTFQTTPNPISSSSLHNKHNEYQSLLTEDDNTFNKDKPLSLKRTLNTDYGYIHQHHNNNNNSYKETTSLRKRFLSKERFKSFDNTTHRNYIKHNELANYIPSSLSNRSIRKDKHHQHYYNNNNNNTSSSYSITDYSLDKRCNTTSNIIYSRNAKRNYNIYTSTQGSITSRNEVNRCEHQSRKRSYKDKESYCSYDGENYNNCYDSEDNKDEERIISEFERVIKDNKNKSDLINKAIALYQTSTGNELNDNMDIQDVLFEWIKKLAMMSKKNGNEEDNKYKQYCESIMQKHKLNNFDELKGMVNNALRRANKKSNFMEGIKKLLLLENTYNTTVPLKKKY